MGFVLSPTSARLSSRRTRRTVSASSRISAAKKSTPTPLKTSTVTSSTSAT
jgi:hypothetical protein